MPSVYALWETKCHIRREDLFSKDVAYFLWHIPEHCLIGGDLNRVMGYISAKSDAEEAAGWISYDGLVGPHPLAVRFTDITLRPPPLDWTEST